MFIHGSVVQFLDESEIREMAELQGSVLYHEFKKFDFEIFGYSVAIDHLTMYPSNSTQICYSCYGDLGIVSYRNNKWSYEETGGWVS